DTFSTYLNRIESQNNITVMKKTEILEFSGSFPKFLTLINTPDGTKKLTTNAVILATGFQPYNPSSLKQYGYGLLGDVVTSFELERMLKDGHFFRPSNKEKPEIVVFIQCVGSRDCGFNDYCSDFCCNNAVKLAKIIRRSHPDVRVSVFYIDMRTPYEGENEFRDARRLGVHFYRGKPAQVRKDGDSLTVEVEDTLENDLVFAKASLVVLSIGGVPDPTVNQLSEAMHVDLSDSGFFAVDETMVGTNVEGIFVVGAASGPKDTAYSMVQGSCAAAKVEVLFRTSLNPKVS
ncbi:FAD-dependent oxidoreductase, partial [Candidatus Bathyarchaeota archaeon]|nr:FAD-dependent oxidoreductase [Candidatus Bathyarchaeota archaeon]